MERASFAAEVPVPFGFVDGAGHFQWFERPGCVRAALKRLAG